jgi:hypothetical protein
MDRFTDRARAGTISRTVGRRLVAGGFFRERDAAVAALVDLRAAGFRPRDIGAITRDGTALGEPTGETGPKVLAGAGAGALGGGLLGGLVGWLAGLGALALPGVGSVLAGGALTAAFGVVGGAAVNGAGLGAAAGGIVGGLVGLGVPEEEACRHERGLRGGGVLVTVAAGDRADEALTILARRGAEIGTVGAVLPQDAIVRGAPPASAAHGPESMELSTGPAPAPPAGGW